MTALAGLAGVAISFGGGGVQPLGAPRPFRDTASTAAAAAPTSGGASRNTDAGGTVPASGGTDEGSAGGAPNAVRAVPTAAGTSLPASRDEALTADGWRRARPDFEWSFPADHWAHREFRTEWWYLTGHLETIDEPTREYGFQFTIFRIGLRPSPPEVASDWGATTVLMGHASIVDKGTGEHRFAELLYREVPFLAEFGQFPNPLLARTRAPAGTDGEWWIRWNDAAFDVRAADDRQGFAFELTTRPLKPPVLQGERGFSAKTADGTSASHYYSFTRLETSGRVIVDGRERRVTGESWMDKEFSTSHLGDVQVGWDWFSCQLADGRELMVYQLRRADGSRDHATGTLVTEDGRARYLRSAEIDLLPGRVWRSAETGGEYPVEWILRVPSAGLDLRVVPVADDQENVTSAGPEYWEGAIRLHGSDGAAAGHGYLEMSGYAKGGRPPI